VKEEKTPEAPKVEEKKSEPVKEEKAPEAPKAEEKKSEPVKEEKTPEAPKVEEKKSEPVKEEKAPETPKAEEKKSEPIKEEKTPEAPKVEEKKSEPVKEEKTPETPKVEEKKSEPVKEEKAPEAPKVEEKKHGRKVVIKHVKVKAVSAKKNAEHKLTVEAPVEKAPEVPKAEEKKSEPVKEEKAPDKAMENVKEIPKVEEKKPEPVKEEKKPVMEAAPEKPSFSYAEQFGAEDEGTVVLNDYSRSTMADLPTAKLIRRSNKETAIITKHVFTIGKERARVDYCVTNNRTVSRFHATIYRRTDGYYVVDNNSTNRTFVNGSPIPVQTEIRLRNGDILRLSNEEFDFIEE
ncbi:MAG: FHA domain-containing protein, partial [Ruminococcus sp.]|nr:FHA domain-containing protein [Ruminococcus sp.]